MQDLIFMIYDKWEAYCERAFWLGRKGHKKKPCKASEVVGGLYPFPRLFLPLNYTALFHFYLLNPQNRACSQAIQGLEGK